MSLKDLPLFGTKLQTNYNTTIQTNNYYADFNQRVLCDNSLTVYLPTNEVNSNQTIDVVSLGNHTITVNGNGKLINGLPTYTINQERAAICLVSFNGNYLIINNYILPTYTPPPATNLDILVDITLVPNHTLTSNTKTLTLIGANTNFILYLGTHTNGKNFIIQNNSNSIISVQTTLEVFRIYPFSTLQATQTALNQFSFVHLVNPYYQLLNDYFIGSQISKIDYIISTSSGGSNVDFINNSIQVLCGGAANRYATLSKAINTNLFQNKTTILSFRAKLNALNIIGQTFHTFLGFGNLTNQNIHTEGIYFYYDNTSLNWQIVCVSGSVQTSIVTSFAASINEVLFKIEIVSNTIVRFFANDLFIGEITTNIPNASNLNFKIVKTLGNQQKYFTIDRINMLIF